MHLYVAARGQADRINRWENDLLAKYYPYQFQKDKPKGSLQLGVRPIRFYEIVFPEDQYEEVLNTIAPTESWNPKYNKFIGFFRRLLKLDKVDLKKVVPNNKLMRMFVEVAAIGTKKDRFNEDGIEQL